MAWGAIAGLASAALTAGGDSTPGIYLPGVIRKLLRKMGPEFAAVYMKCTPAQAAAFLGIPHAQVVEQARAEGSEVIPASYFPVTASQVNGKKSNTTLALVGIGAFLLLT